MIHNISTKTLMGAIPAVANSYGYTAQVGADIPYAAPSMVYCISPLYPDASKNKELVIRECEALLGYVFEIMFSKVSVKPFVTVRGDNIFVPTELFFKKVNLWHKIRAEFPTCVIPGDVHAYRVGQFELDDLGSILEVVEVCGDDTYDDKPFAAVFDKLAEYGVHMDEDKLKRGSSSAIGRFILLPETVMAPRRAGEVKEGENGYFSTNHSLSGSA